MSKNDILSIDAEGQNELMDVSLKASGAKIINGLVLREVTDTQICHYETGNRHRRHREAACVSLRALAGEMGLSAPYLSDLERGRRAWNEKLSVKYVACLVVVEEKKR